ncbi:hypothetical protein N7532_001046 [Penicillium argentinense]|uniref:GRIP domain-containing protein n=1 Tax=Penicillium argentinense TaxID=1131581 RepID=A0A9W9G1Z4_9EURO|nr:uncharacterized protein N7532_001046 [Penicillium argentinense]KAJ5110511.1 hypothetical protein N7532_001046 [Penicillium argentinense]
MFQRLRDAIDGRIAEEQARQKTAQENLSRSASARRPNSNLSAGQRTRPRRHSGTPVRGPDPKEFEAEFAIGDDESSSRSATPRVDTPDGGSELNEGATESDPKETDTADAKTETQKTDKSEKTEKTEKEPTSAPSTEPTNQAPSELPAEVKGKLRRLDKLETRYHELLKAYRVAHSRVLSIEPFEAALRENTPLTSIGEPKALTEYLNQTSLKTDMVMDELKRVSTEREDFKKRLEEAQKSAKDAWDEVAGLKENKEQTPAEEEKKSTEENKETSEEFFSFDNEVPRLEGELKEREEEIETLKTEVEKLKKDLSVTRESTEGMVQNLETSTRELVELRDTKDKLDAEIEELKTSKQKDIDGLKNKLTSAESSLEKATTEAEQLKTDLQDKGNQIEKLQAQVSNADKSTKTEPDADVASKLEQANKDKDASQKKLDVLQRLVDSLRNELKESTSTVEELKKEVNRKFELGKLYGFLDSFAQATRTEDVWRQAKLELAEADKEGPAGSSTAAEKPSEPEASTAAEQKAAPAAAATGGVSGGGKKKNKKKKKGGKAAEEPAKPAETPEEKEKPVEAEPSLTSGELGELRQKIESLTHLLEEKEAAIDRLSAKLKGEEDLKEEIESLRDDLVNVGQEHVESKDKIKELTAEKSALEETISKLEKELVEIRTSSESSTADSAKMHTSLKEEFETLKVRAATLETDLSAAQQLAATRFKDLTDLRETLQKIQPELRDLRAESSELKNLKETLSNKNTELIALEAKHEDLRAELRSSKTKITERDTEVKTLNKKIRQETDSRLKAEENLTLAQSDLRSAETKKQEAVNAKEKTAGELSKAQDGLKNSRTKMREMDEQLAQVAKELEGLREEISLKTAQHASAQSLMNSMRDQTSEVAMQMKEAREKCESLEEELADAHRLLNERTREGESMRRLLNDIEGRTESKVRELKERMEEAIEERDRVEEEANTQGRRRAREIEDLKSSLRDTERALRSQERDKEDLMQSHKDWQRRRDELELLTEQSTQEAEEVRQAMAGLRDQLDSSEKQVRDLEKDKAELRRSVEEINSRLEKLRRSHQTLGEDVRLRGSPSGRQSSRSSMDSGSRRGLASPVGKERSVSIQRSETPIDARSAKEIDYMYLKNVLLQFMEQKDKNYQKQLVPVLAKLLHFEPADEQKWMSAIMSR